MAFSRYDPKTKAAIIKAATDDRAAGKTWAQAHSAAKAVGYKGSPEGLDVMIRMAKKKAGKEKTKAMPAKPTAAPAKASTKPSQHAPTAAAKAPAVNRYDPREKATFIKAALDARAAGKSWKQAHAVAKAAGYKGKLKGLNRMIRVSKRKMGKTKTKAMQAKPKAASAAPAKAMTKPSKPANAPATDYDSVQQMIDQIVKKRLRAVVEKAVTELRKAVG